MELTEKGNAMEQSDAVVIRGSSMVEQGHATGVYGVKCFDKDGNLKWEDTFQNVVTDVGANQVLTSGLGTAYLSLISSVGYTGIPVAADTMISHASSGHVWVEAGNGTNYPTWSTPTYNTRRSVTWGTAASRSVAITAVTFTIDTGGTVKGCFMVNGTGASSTNSNTSGVLYSAGVFTSGDKVVSAADILQVTYSTAV